MDSSEIRRKFLKFFEDRGHKVLPSASLVPEGDPSVLFTTAGMQQFKSYYILPELAPAKNIATIQRCVRTSDIEEVGDENHLTFFEMLGNFSFGGYLKEEAIKYAHEFITGRQWMNLKIDYVSVFGGEGDVPADEQSENIWRDIDPNIQIRQAGRKDNFWGPTGDEGPCGPTTEIYVNGVEIWNIVFNEYYQRADKTLERLKTLGVDTGMGLERLAMVAQKVSTVFETDLFAVVMKAVQAGDERTRRIVADHVRSAVFMMADGVRPSNTERGYVLRRLIRRVTSLNRPQVSVDEAVIKTYKNQYPELESKSKEIMEEIKNEEARFEKTLAKGLKEFEKGIDPFTLYTTYGFPIDMVKELAAKKNMAVDGREFEKRFREHQEISRAGAEKKFKGGLADTNDETVKLHTATHLLHQALRDILGGHVEQRGSNITAERLRFDFSHPQKMTEEKKKKVEEVVNRKIKERLPVKKVILPREEAERSGALHSFGEKYGDEVSVYFIGETLENAYSKEFCGGPHVENTSALGRFKIVKEEAVSAGVRRIKAVLDT